MQAEWQPCALVDEKDMMLGTVDSKRCIPSVNAASMSYVLRAFAQTCCLPREGRHQEIES